MADLVSQSEFARLLGVSRSYITKLKADGRLVLAGASVDVEASRALILETADPNRDDVVQRWAKQRDEALPAVANEDGDEEPRVGSYADARARKENAAADMAEMERDRLRGTLIERVAVEVAVEDVMTTVRQGLEQQPHRVAPQLVGLDLDGIRAVLKQENSRLLNEMVRDFQQRMQQIAVGEA